MESANQITLDKYVVNREATNQLNQGGQSYIQIVEDQEKSKNYVAKTYGAFSIGVYDNAYKNELTALQTLGKHENIIKLKNFNIEGVMSCKQKNYKKPYILLEYCQFGSLIQNILQSQISEKTARFIFNQLLNVLNYCHENGIFHYDIKPDNILIREKNGKCQIKLADFGLSMNKSCFGQRGTRSYMPPEMLLNKQCSGIQTDMFALGITLFIMIRGAPPFEEARIDNKLYSMLIKKPQDFWRIFKLSTQDFSEQFKDLIQKMLEFDPNKRLVYKEIIDHDWVKGECSSPEEALEEFIKSNKVM